MAKIQEIKSDSSAAPGGRTEGSLEECESRLKWMFDHMHSGVAVYEPVDDGNDFVFLDFNKAAERIDHITREQVVGKRVSDVFPNVEEFGLLDVMRRVWRTGKPEHHPVSLYRDERIVGWRENYVYQVPSGEIVALYDDVTEEKQVRDSLKESEERLRNMVEHLPAGAVFRDRDALFLNKAAEEITGYPRSELSTVDDWFRKLYGKRYEERRSLYEKSRTSGFPTRRMLPITRKDGRKRWVEFAAYSYEKGEVWLLHDITDLKKTEEELREHQKQLRLLTSELSLAEDRERRRLATELHDGLGQALSVAHVKLDLLRDLQTTAEAATALEETRQLIDQAIDDTRSLTFALSSPVLHQMGLVPALQQLCADMAKQYGGRFSVEEDQRPKSLSSELRMVLFRCVRELLINVAKHAEADETKVRLTTDEHRLRITVEDDGVGFDASQIGRSLSPSGGFGLFNMHEYLNHMGGSLRIQSAPSRGTHVLVEAPLQADRQMTPLQEGSEEHD